MKKKKSEPVSPPKTMRKMNCENPGEAERRTEGYLNRNPEKKLEVWMKGKLAYRIEIKDTKI
jgi:hypothetical protein